MYSYTPTKYTNRREPNPVVKSFFSSSYPIYILNNHNRPILQEGNTCPDKPGIYCSKFPIYQEKQARDLQTASQLMNDKPVSFAKLNLQTMKFETLPNSKGANIIIVTELIPKIGGKRKNTNKKKSKKPLKNRTHKKR
jgi:hypothetical protein